MLFLYAAGLDRISGKTLFKVRQDTALAQKQSDHLGRSAFAGAVAVFIGADGTGDADNAFLVTVFNAGDTAGDLKFSQITDGDRSAGTAGSHAGKRDGEHPVHRQKQVPRGSGVYVWQGGWNDHCL